jgi:nitrogen-specific signal transduction histidine kinase
MAEFPRGLAVRDYDVSLPEFRGDREQLIQALLNIVQNAAHALAARIAAGDARIVLRTRVARQATIGKERSRLALELHVEDNGPGVPESIRDRIFFRWCRDARRLWAWASPWRRCSCGSIMEQSIANRCQAARCSRS